LAERGVVAHSKKVRQEKRSLLFIDESGLLMAPLVRRTWAKRGLRPVLRQRGRHREKVSLAAALWLSADGESEKVSYRMLMDSYFNNNEAVAVFLTELLAKTNRPATVIWDGGNMHRGEPIRDLLSREGACIQLKRLPAYAPMLNPVEQLWSWLKYSRLCNYAPKTVIDPQSRARKELKSVQRNGNASAPYGTQANCRSADINYLTCNSRSYNPTPERFFRALSVCILARLFFST
jgi:transposase